MESHRFPSEQFALTKRPQTAFLAKYCYLPWSITCAVNFAPSGEAWGTPDISRQLGFLGFAYLWEAGWVWTFVSLVILNSCSDSLVNAVVFGLSFRSGSYRFFSSLSTENSCYWAVSLGVLQDFALKRTAGWGPSGNAGFDLCGSQLCWGRRRMAGVCWNDRMGFRDSAVL